MLEVRNASVTADTAHSVSTLKHARLVGMQGMLGDVEIPRGVSSKAVLEDVKLHVGYG